MTKRDFEAIAANVREANETWEGASYRLYKLAHSHADYFEATYPRFNREAFITACGF